MAFVKNIQGLGGITDGSNLAGTLPNYQVFDGSTYCTIAAYDPLPIGTERTILTLSKSNTPSINGTLISSRHNVIENKQEKIVIGSVNVYQIVDASDDKIRITDGRNQTSKWDLSVWYWDGAANTNNMNVVKNGFATTTSLLNDAISGSINTNSQGFIGADSGGSATLFDGDIAILTVYEGLFTPAQITEFNANPFDFNNSLAAGDCHLRVDFNRTTGQIPLDTSSFARIITLTGTSTFATFP